MALTIKTTAGIIVYCAVCSKP